MKTGQIITLDDNEKYLLLQKTIQEDHTFFYANKLDEKESLTSNYELFEEIIDNGQTYIDVVEDEEVRDFLYQVFTVNLIEEADKIEKDESILND